MDRRIDHDQMIIAVSYLSLRFYHTEKSIQLVKIVLAMIVACLYDRIREVNDMFNVELMETDKYFRYIE